MGKLLSIFVSAFILYSQSLAASVSKSDAVISSNEIKICLQKTMLVTTLNDSTVTSIDTLCCHLSNSALDSTNQKKSFSTKELRKKKFISAVCAFPFPLGFVGAHRIMLGTKPWIPVVYVATFGGCFGLLPLIDFCTIVFSKDIEQYENNPAIFMWVK